MLLNCGVGEDSWESLGRQGDPVHSEGDQAWDFFGKNDAKAETPILWLPHVKSWLIGKDSDAGKDWGQEEKGMTEDDMAGWHHWLDGRESEWSPGGGDGQGGLACCDSWGHKESDTLSNWTELNWTQLHPSTDNWIKDSLSMAPPNRTRPSFPLSQSLPPITFHKLLILPHQRADRLKTAITKS